MATAFFSRARGTVVKLAPFGDRPAFQLGIDGKGNKLGLTTAIITQCGLSQAGNFQFLHTLSDTIYLYVFGNKIGELVVSGIAFGSYYAPPNCSTPPKIYVTGQETPKDGISEIITQYNLNQVAARNKPIPIAFGTVGVFNAFLTGMQLGIQDPESGLGQWTFRFANLPTKALGP